MTLAGDGLINDGENAASVQESFPVPAPRF